MTRPALLILLSTFLIGAVATATGDMIHLKDGRKLNGSVTRQDGRYVLKTETGTTEFPDEQVLFVVRDKKPTDPPSRPRTGPPAPTVRFSVETARLGLQELLDSLE